MFCLFGCDRQTKGEMERENDGRQVPGKHPTPPLPQAEPSLNEDVATKTAARYASGEIGVCELGNLLFGKGRSNSEIAMMWESALAKLKPEDLSAMLEIVREQAPVVLRPEMIAGIVRNANATDPSLAEDLADCLPEGSLRRSAFMALVRTKEDITQRIWSSSSPTSSKAKVFGLGTGRCR